MSLVKKIGLLIILSAGLLFFPLPSMGGQDYSYYVDGQRINLQPSPDLFVVKSDSGSKGLITKELAGIGVEFDPLSQRAELEKRG
jgi:hypothetical protein